MGAMDSLHDAEIISLESDWRNNILKITFSLNASIVVLTFNEAVHWEFTPFEVQNVVYEVSYYNVVAAPAAIKEDFDVLQDFMNGDYFVAFINPSSGLGGIIIYKTLSTVRV